LFKKAFETLCHSNFVPSNVISSKRQFTTKIGATKNGKNKKKDKILIKYLIKIFKKKNMKWENDSIKNKSFHFYANKILIPIIFLIFLFKNIFFIFM